MSGKETKVEEQIVGTDLAGAGGSSLPEPVETGDAHANRPQDNPQSDADVARVAGQDVSRAQLIQAIVAQLVGMDNADLSQIVSAISLEQDVTAPGAAAAPLGGAQGGNLASITTKEDVAELFSGEELTEEYKEKATVIFEAAVQARVAVEREAIKEQAERDVEAAVESMAAELVGQVDRYVTFAAEQFVETQKEQLETVTRNTVAESFLADVVGLVEKYKISSDPEVVAANEAYEAKIAELETKINEQVEALVSANEELKGFRQKEVFDSVAESLTPMQRGRFAKLAETVEFDTVEGYKNRLTIVKESVVKTGESAPAAKPLNEATIDGVPPVNEAEVQAPQSVSDPLVKSVTSLLGRQFNS